MDDKETMWLVWPGDEGPDDYTRRILAIDEKIAAALYVANRGRDQGGCIEEMMVFVTRADDQKSEALYRVKGETHITYTAEEED